ncbi:ArsR/SmtB family transcription factor [Undibacterium crateris]|uniref:ArsR/SmtB family transcription factor n=1 Tax=Undibacterium crateris TaxID=2528175 RepID=UPI001389E400|nr:metalloregulator ArsR/SmtB family transcription factor [Undibacterium crateris]NDI86699.1 metalloregulator ArsR/SmtB family transcription factor [Undibacterium crateris]
MDELSLEALSQVAGYFAALSEPTRLQILSLLRNQERNVGELAELCGYTSANISRHLAILNKHGLVAKESRGTSVFYRIADESIYTLCDVVCGSLLKQLEEKARSQKEFAQSARLSKNP